jgi:hypothetical protein
MVEIMTLFLEVESGRPGSSVAMLVNRSKNEPHTTKQPAVLELPQAHHEIADLILRRKDEKLSVESDNN